MTFNQKEKLIQKVEKKFLRMITDECEYKSSAWWTSHYMQDQIINLLKKEIIPNL